jgi:photosystem II stability/assembly factor-like uncharacterized protein
MKLYIIYIVLIACILSQISYPNEWEICNIGFDNSFYDLLFVDQDNGWAVGENSIIISTSDGGKNWHQLDYPVDSVRLNKIQFITKDIGFIVGGNGLFLSTENCGKTWEIQDCGVDYNLNDLSFLSDSIGWVVGSLMQPPVQVGVILKTVDGGHTWQQQFNTDYDQPINSSLRLPYRFYCVSFINESEGWALGVLSFDNFGPSFILKTSDGGLNWELVGEPTPQSWRMTMLSPNSIWVGGFGFAVSTDGGREWNSVSISGLVADFVQSDDNTGWLLGKQSASTPYKLYYTDNNWSSHVETDVPGNDTMYRLANIGNDNLWVLCADGILYCFERNTSSIENPKLNILKNCYRLSNFPNPFNANTQISYTVPVKSNITISVYDINARQIDNLKCEFHKPGDYSITWNAELVPSGIYFITMCTDEYKICNKCLLVK